MKLEHRKQAAQRAGDASREQLADGLEKYADDIESEGRTYAPAFMREAAKRLRADQPAPTETGPGPDELAGSPQSAPPCHHTR